MRTRLLIAGITAPLVGITIVAAAMRIGLGFQDASSREVLNQTSHALFFLVFFGALPAYLIELGIGIPAWRYLARRQRLAIAPIVAVGAAAGAVTFALSWSALFEGWNAQFLLQAAGIGALGGAAAGLWFWLVAIGFERQALGS